VISLKENSDENLRPVGTKNAKKERNNGAQFF
jgi:hypothetical protein